MKITVYTLIIIYFFGINTYFYANANPDLQYLPAKYTIAKNSKSNVEFWTSNYGIFGLNSLELKAGVIWPRGSNNNYVFASGLWFGAVKRNPKGDTTKYVAISYNPNSGVSWFSPGKIDDKDTANPSYGDKYKIYQTTDFDKETGQLKFSKENHHWPYWIYDDNVKNELGNPLFKYVDDTLSRNLSKYPKGPMFVSDEDFVSFYNDNDLSRYEGGSTNRKNAGYPLGLDIESRIYSWEKDEDLKNIVILSYIIQNKSKDTLINCFLSGIFDTDLFYNQNNEGVSNDRAKFYDADSSLNMVVNWTDTDKGEFGKGFGYMGIVLIESPSVDKLNNIQIAKTLYQPNEQIGTISARIAGIDNDKLTDESRYNFISMGINDIFNGRYDLRNYQITGPFNFKPEERIRVAFALVFAKPSKGVEADGTDADMDGLVKRVKKLYAVYYQNLSQVEDENNEITVSEIYPNPAKHIINIDYNIEKEGLVEIEICDALGISIFSTAPMWNKIGLNKQILNLDKSFFSKGLYFVRIKANNQLMTKKFIVGE